MWDFGKPIPSVLPTEASGLTSITVQTSVLIHLGNAASAIQP
jgi:hypothetical protein